MRHRTKPKNTCTYLKWGMEKQAISLTSHWQLPSATEFEQEKSSSTLNLNSSIYWPGRFPGGLIILTNVNRLPDQSTHRNVGTVTSLSFRPYFFLHKQSLKCSLVWPGGSQHSRIPGIIIIKTEKKDQCSPQLIKG